MQPSANLFAAGKAAFEKGDYSGALSYFKLEQENDDGTDTATTHCWIAYCHYRLGDYAAASRAFEQSMEDGPQSDNTPLWWAASVAKQGIDAFENQEYREAVAHFQAILEKVKLEEVRRKDTLLWLGLSHQMLAEYSKAIESFEKVLAMSPSRETSKAKRYLAYVLATSPDARLRDGYRARRIADDLCDETYNRDWVCMTLRAAALAEISDFEEAIACYEKAMELMPQNERSKRLDTLRTLRQRKPIRCNPEIDIVRMYRRDKVASVDD